MTPGGRAGWVLLLTISLAMPIFGPNLFAQVIGGACALLWIAALVMMRRDGFGR